MATKNYNQCMQFLHETQQKNVTLVLSSNRMQVLYLCLHENQNVNNYNEIVFTELEKAWGLSARQKEYKQKIRKHFEDLGFQVFHTNTDLTVQDFYTCLNNTSDVSKAESKTDKAHERAEKLGMTASQFATYVKNKTKILVDADYSDNTHDTPIDENIIEVLNHLLNDFGFTKKQLDSYSSIDLKNSNDLIYKNGMYIPDICFKVTIRKYFNKYFKKQFQLLNDEQKNKMIYKIIDKWQAV